MAASVINTTISIISSSSSSLINRSREIPTRKHGVQVLERNKSRLTSIAVHQRRHNLLHILSCLPSSSSSNSRFNPSTKLFVSGLSFRTTEESLRNAFKNFGQLVQVNLVMDKIANRPRGFAFLRYATEEESKKAIQGMHGKFLDGRVIFVEIAKSKSELGQSFKENSRQ